MQQSSLFLEGQRDYFKIEGQTGPLVYPAGFLYIYSGLLLTIGNDIQRAQYVFAGLYIATLAVVHRIHRKLTFPTTGFVLLSLSKRIHSIYVLRLFNDPFAMLFMFMSILSLMRRRWELASVFFSLALSVKMNILLFAPGFAYIFYFGAGLRRAVLNSLVVAAIQALLGLPFLVSHPSHYLQRAFELGRQFFYKWTVNWRFVDEEVFLSREFSLVLVVMHISTLIVLAITVWPRRSVFSPDDIALIIFSSNFVGIVFARSLHYQFYSWYFFTLPYLLWRTKIPIPLKLALLGCIEYAWNVYPSTVESSLLLFASHLIILLGLILGLEPVTINTPSIKNKVR